MIDGESGEKVEGELSVQFSSVRIHHEWTYVMLSASTSGPRHSIIDAVVAETEKLVT